MNCCCESPIKNMTKNPPTNLEYFIKAELCKGINGDEFLTSNRICNDSLENLLRILIESQAECISNVTGFQDQQFE